ncbi:hypothetical protein PHMEG_00035422 [Phytophthora megakarya]|uniref:CCHC-type domain-containing protein n=1 Tax=Phytophthora megakarya TaxID=4795 RepID=A0A225URJ8_9STRA|nr:hypothetical protein PHMEG_00035422 [Phytophthora megakarya]
MQTQFQMQMQQAKSRFEYLLASQGNRRKKDPPTNEGKFDEDLKLWIFAKKRILRQQTRASLYLIGIELSRLIVKLQQRLRPGNCSSWELFKLKLRGRFRPKDVEYNLRERLFQLNQQGTIHEYYGLRAETAKKVKELSSRFFHEVIEIATDFELAHYGRQSAKKKSMDRKNTSKGDSKDEWTKTATCHNCGPPGHIKPQCKATKETNFNVSGSIDAILEVSAWASKQSEPPSAVSIFVDNGSSLNGVTEELANQLQLDIIEHPDDLMTVMLGYNQTEYNVQKP